MKAPFPSLLDISLLAHQEMLNLTIWVFFPMILLIFHPSHTLDIYLRGQLLGQGQP